MNDKLVFWRHDEIFSEPRVRGVRRAQDAAADSTAERDGEAMTDHVSQEGYGTQRTAQPQHRSFLQPGRRLHPAPSQELLLQSSSAVNGRETRSRAPSSNQAGRFFDEASHRK